MTDLLPGVGEAPFDHFSTVLTSGGQAFAKDLQGWGHDEYPDRARNQAAHLLGSLPIYLQDDVASGRTALIDPALRSAIEVPMHFRAFQELSATGHGEKPVPGNEMILASVLLSRARW